MFQKQACVEYTERFEAVQSSVPDKRGDSPSMHQEGPQSGQAMIISIPEITDVGGVVSGLDRTMERSIALILMLV